MGILRFGQKIIGQAEKASRFGEKVLGGVSAFGNKVASTVRSVAGKVASVPILGAVSAAPVFGGHSAQSKAGQVASGAEQIAGMADTAQAGLKIGSNIVRAGRELGAANTPGEKFAAAKDLARQGQAIQKLG